MNDIFLESYISILNESSKGDDSWSIRISKTDDIQDEDLKDIADKIALTFKKSVHKENNADDMIENVKEYFKNFKLNDKEKVKEDKEETGEKPKKEEEEQQQ